MFIRKGIFNCLVLLSLLTTSTALLAQSAPPLQPEFLLPANPDAVVISYSEIPDMLANPDLTPRIQVFADGRVMVHYSPYMKRAGDYQLFLNPGELRQLLLAVSGVVGLYLS